jgi:hypothetical protein
MTPHRPNLQMVLYGIPASRSPASFMGVWRPRSRIPAGPGPHEVPHSACSPGEGIGAWPHGFFRCRFPVVSPYSLGER